MTATVDAGGIFDGPAELDIAGHCWAVRVRLTGQLNPVDGRYHWQGLIYGAPSDLPTGKAGQLRIQERSAAARLVERIPSGQVMISGVGAPPYDLPPV
ncbi:DUF4873 domain-containing protein [Mycolicibacterium thermoresistibile]